MRHPWLGLAGLTGLLAVGPGSLPAAAQDMHDYAVTAFEELEFAPFGEGSPLQLSVLWGDPAKGPSGFLLRIPAGFEQPLHSHTANYRAIILDGEAIHWLDGEDKSAAKRIGTGGFWSQPGSQVHGDANPTDGDTLALIIFDGPVDFIMPK